MRSNSSKNKFFGTFVSFRRTKKAQAATGLVLFFGIITIFLLMLFYMLIIRDEKFKKEYDGLQYSIDSQITLLNYLKTQTSQGTDIAEQIAKYKLTNDQAAKEQIIQQSKKIFNTYFKGTSYDWKITIEGEELIKEKKRCSQTSKISQDILQYDGTTIKVELTCG